LELIENISENSPQKIDESDKYQTKVFCNKGIVEMKEKN
jgi:hypothetical protein